MRRPDELCSMPQKTEIQLRLFDLGRESAELITNFDSTGVSSVKGATGSGTGHVYTLHFDAGGQIGRHPAGPAQLFMVVAGAGWVEGENGARRDINLGEAAYFTPGEVHAKGSESGMTAIMVQLERLEPVAPERDR
jgi:quercetin dioxygenase-like cupin family protein